MSSSNKRPFYSLKAVLVLTELKVDPSVGLTSFEAEQRLEKYGPNEVTSTGERHFLRILVEQFINPMILLLIGVSLLSLIIGHRVDAMIIGVIVVLNALIGFVQEFRAERAMKSIRQMAAPVAKVLRDGKRVRLPGHLLVPGDLVILEAGDRVPCDLRLIESKNLKVNESLLTGESIPVFKGIDPLQEKDLPLGEQSNMSFMGTHILNGRGVGVCVATGHQTELGNIAGLLKSNQMGKVPLKARMDRLTRHMALAALVLCFVIFVVGLLQGTKVIDMLLTAITLAVAAIPEGLPAVITIGLSLGSLRLARHGVLVRQLQAVEALGSVTVICADKTGTLTENRMKVKLPQVQDPVPSFFIEALILCNDASLSSKGNSEAGDPMEIALLQFAQERRTDSEQLRARWRRISEIPFDTERKRMTTLHDFEGGNILFTKGAPEMVIPLCKAWTQEAKIVPLTEEMKNQLSQKQEEMALDGLRVLAVAMKSFENVPILSPLEDQESDLVFLGFVALQDPLRPEARQAIAECRKAGIRPIMMTGDYEVTAKAIGKELGIYQEGDQIVTGYELKKSGQKLHHQVSHVSIFARVSPEDKLSIIHILKEKKELVAMTGDGVNDAPALKKADVGIAMGRGTDVAKEASALILVEENFSTIVRAIKEGRVIYDNIRKFVRYMLTTNLGEIATMLIAISVGLPIPLLPVQILWINLVTDGLPAVALGFEPPEGNVMVRKPRLPGENILARGLWQHTLWVGLLMGLLTMGVMAFFWKRGYRIDHIRTIAFTALTLAQMGHVLGIRSESRHLWQIGLLSNWRLLGAVLFTFLSQYALIYLEPLQKIFHTTSLSFVEGGITLLPALIIYIVVEVEKGFQKRKGN